MEVISFPESLRRPLRGIIPPMVTPLLDRDTLDIPGLERLVEHILSGGVHGLFILGTTGEAPSLSYALRRDLIRRTCQQVKGRVPILVGITDTAFVESVHLAQFSADCGASGLVMAPPYYFPAGQPELLEYLQHLTAQLPLPLFLYNMPSHTKLVFEPETVTAAAEIPGVIGLKDSSANMIYFRKLQNLLAKHEDFSLLVGPEELLGEAVLAGAHGGICGGANMFPRLYVDLYRAAAEKNLSRVEILHQKVMQISQSIYTVGMHGSSYLKGLKCALSCMHLCSDFMAEPFHRFREPQRQTIAQHLADIELLLNDTSEVKL